MPHCPKTDRAVLAARHRQPLRRRAGTARRDVSVRIDAASLEPVGCRLRHRSAGALSRGPVRRSDPDARRSRDVARRRREPGTRRCESVLAASTCARSSGAAGCSADLPSELVAADSRVMPDETPARFLRASTRRAIARPTDIAALIDHLDSLLYNPDVPCSKQSLRTLRSGSASIAGRCRAARAFVIAVRRCRESCVRRRASASVRRPTATSICRGCKRFAHEIVAWNGYTDDQRERVWQRSVCAA